MTNISNIRGERLCENHVTLSGTLMSTVTHWTTQHFE